MDKLIRDWIAKHFPHLSPEDGYDEYRRWADAKFSDELPGEDDDDDEA